MNDGICAGNVFIVAIFLGPLAAAVVKTVMITRVKHLFVVRCTHFFLTQYNHIDPLYKAH